MYLYNVILLREMAYISEIMCGTPPDIDNVDLSIHHHQLSSTVQYTCLPGYITEGTVMNSNCTEEGWTTPDIVCLKAGRFC